MAAKTYDFGQVTVVFGGVALSGYAEEDPVEVEYDDDSWTLEMGADGEGTRSKSNNLAATIRVRLQQSSDSMDVLQAAHTADRLSNSGSKPLLIKDGSGRSIHAAETAWVQKLPVAPYGKASQQREWVLRTDRLETSLGGNP